MKTARRMLTRREARARRLRTHMPTLPLLAALVLLMALAGCGSGNPAVGESASPPPSSSSESASATPSQSPSGGSQAELERAVRAYSEAFLGGKAKAAWLMRSEAAQASISYAEFKVAVDAAAQIYGDAEMTALEVVDNTGRAAHVTYRYDIGELDQVREPWVYQDGQWRCDQ